MYTFVLFKASFLLYSIKEDINEGMGKIDINISSLKASWSIATLSAAIFFKTKRAFTHTLFFFYLPSGKSSNLQALEKKKKKQISQSRSTPCDKLTQNQHWFMEMQCSICVLFFNFDFFKHYFKISEEQKMLSRVLERKIRRTHIYIYHLPINWWLINLLISFYLISTWMSSS